MNTEPRQAGIHVDVPGSGPLVLTHLILDFTGTLSLDGHLLPGVAERLRELGNQLSITVLTADTFGTAARQLEGLPVTLRHIQTGRDKADFMAGLPCSQTAAVGNGRNDVAMVRMAALGVAVIGPEGCAGELVAAAKVVCRDILDIFDLLRRPLRLKATLRE
ncbi:MAG: ATPase P [Desulfobacteraceae bacterium]|nr:MAG: ATPase P [Desulfobacteraceae bacterium]